MVKHQPVRTWPEWLGGITLTATVCLPWFVAVQVSDSHPGVAVRVACAALVALPLLLLSLLAPFVGARRRDVVWALVPFWALRMAWVFGSELVRISNYPAARQTSHEKPAVLR